MKQTVTDGTRTPNKMVITRLKLDTKGRITLPKQFREGNKIVEGSYVELIAHVHPANWEKKEYGQCSVLLSFEHEEE